MSCRYCHSLGQKNHTGKISNIKKGFELYQIFIHDFLCQTVPIFPLYILFTNYPNYLLLDEPNFVSFTTPNSLVFDLAYTTRNNLILWIIKTAKVC